MVGSQVEQEVRSYVYDDSGMRVEEDADGVTKKFLIDPNNPTGYAQVIEERWDDGSGGDAIAEAHQGGVFCTAEEVPNPAAPKRPARAPARKRRSGR